MMKLSHSLLGGILLQAEASLAERRWNTAYAVALSEASAEYGCTIDQLLGQHEHQFKNILVAAFTAATVYAGPLNNNDLRRAAVLCNGELRPFIDRIVERVRAIFTENTVAPCAVPA